MDHKPDPTAKMTAAEFDRWYWDKPELTAICVAQGLPKTGSKDTLRRRVLQFLETGEAPRDAARKRPAKFNWAKAELTAETRITDPMSFGPNVRRFFASQIGPQFVCHSDFMDWVRANPGETLGAAIEIWHQLEARKDDPAFRRKIAPHNNFLQYLRDYRDANPAHSQHQAKAAWERRKHQPIEGERIVYHPDDASHDG